VLKSEDKLPFNAESMRTSKQLNMVGSDSGV
jgi:hypothetical protein